MEMYRSRSPGERRGELRISVYFKVMHLFFCFAGCQSVFGSLQNWAIQAYTMLSTCFGCPEISCAEAVSVDVSQDESYVTARFTGEIFQYSERHLCTQSIVLFLVLFLCPRYPDVPFFSLPPLRSCHPFLVCHTQYCWCHLPVCGPFPGTTTCWHPWVVVPCISNA